MERGDCGLPAVTLPPLASRLRNPTQLNPMLSPRPLLVLVCALSLLSPDTIGQRKHSSGASRSTPSRQTPTRSTPTRQTPTRSTPVRSTPTRQTPVRSTPTRQTPVRSTPVRSTPTRSTPVRATPTRSTPVRSSPNSVRSTPTPVRTITTPTRSVTTPTRPSTTSSTGTATVRPSSGSVDLSWRARTSGISSDLSRPSSTSNIIDLTSSGQPQRVRFPRPASTLSRPTASSTSTGSSARDRYRTPQAITPGTSSSHRLTESLRTRNHTGFSGGHTDSPSPSTRPSQHYRTQTITRDDILERYRPSARDVARQRLREHSESPVTHGPSHGRQKTLSDGERAAQVRDDLAAKNAERAQNAREAFANKNAQRATDARAALADKNAARAQDARAALADRNTERAKNARAQIKTRDAERAQQARAAFADKNAQRIKTARQNYTQSIAAAPVRAGSTSGNSYYGGYNWCGNYSFGGNSCYNWWWSWPSYCWGSWWHYYWYNGGYWSPGYCPSFYWYGPFYPSSTVIYQTIESTPQADVVYVYEEPQEEVYEAAPIQEGEVVIAEDWAGGTPLPAGNNQLNRAADHYLTLGDQAFQESRFGDAVHFYAKAIEYAPGDGILYLILADALFATGDYHYASYAIRRAFELDPSLAGNIVDKHSFYADPTEFDRQLAVLETYMQDHLLDDDARLVLATNYLFGARPAAAVDLLESAFSQEIRSQPIGVTLLNAARNIQHGPSSQGN